MKRSILIPLLVAALLPAPAAAQKTLVAVFAHPDDERIVAPILARYAREGHNVHLVIATDGGKGVTAHAAIPAGDSLVAVRRGELECSARELGIKPAIMLGHPDGGLASFAVLGKLQADLERVFQELRPDAVVTFGREGGTGHPDHRLVGDVVTEIVQRSAHDVALFFPALPLERMADAPPARPTVRLVAERFLNVRAAYTDGDFAAAERSYLCHRSQYTEAQARANMRYIQHGFRGTVYLRSWNGGARATELF